MRTKDKQEKQDAELLEVFLQPLRLCKEYQPAFGRGKKEKKTSFGSFLDLYGSDQFYAWLGLASEEVYSAHKAAGGLTSVYRQLGVGAERLFRVILMRELGLSEEQIDWAYEYQASPKNKVHTLDARITTSELKNRDKRKKIKDWLSNCLNTVSNNSSVKVDGVVFEVRQGYKSADSKRQNADLRFGINAYQNAFLPVFAVFSNQVSEPVINRYKSDGMLVLTGVSSDDPTVSTFAFFEKVIGFNLANFFERNQKKLSEEVTSIVGTLLKK